MSDHDQFRWRKRKFTVRLIKCDRTKNEDGYWIWETVKEERLNISELLYYFQKMYAMHDNAEPDGDSIDSMIWEDPQTDVLWSVVVDREMPMYRLKGKGEEK